MLRYQRGWKQHMKASTCWFLPPQLSEGLSGITTVHMFSPLWKKLGLLAWGSRQSGDRVWSDHYYTTSVKPAAKEDLQLRLLSFLSYTQQLWFRWNTTICLNANGVLINDTQSISLDLRLSMIWIPRTININNDIIGLISELGLIHRHSDCWQPWFVLLFYEHRLVCVCVCVKHIILCR